jgi:membrane-associated phospholipid phosphatase
VSRREAPAAVAAARYESGSGGSLMQRPHLRRRLRRARRARRGQPNPGYLLIGVAAGAAAAFGLVARKVARHDTVRADRSARDAVRQAASKRRGPKIKRKAAAAAEAAATALSPFGKPWFHGPSAALLAAYTRPRTRSGAAAITMASAGSAGASTLFEQVLKIRKPPPGHPRKDEPSFPSGHTMETAAVALTTAYVLAREGSADGWIAAPAALALPLLSGAGRVFLDRHWTSDVAGGLLAGVSIAALCAAAYELGPD